MGVWGKSTKGSDHSAESYMFFAYSNIIFYFSAWDQDLMASIPAAILGPAVTLKMEALY